MNKSGSRLYIYAPKVEVVPPSVHIYLCWCEDQIYLIYLNHLLLARETVVTLDLEARSMELLFAVFPAFLAIFVFSVVFFCLQQRWFQYVHGDAQQQKEKSVILSLFWAARPAAWFGFWRRRWFLSSVGLIFCWRPCRRRFWSWTLWRICLKITPTTL
jgi:hypothetical protein